MDEGVAGLRARPVNHSAYRVDTSKLPGGIEAHGLEFSGSGGEFFRVWIVNLLLTVLTLGFYTPWARRRTAQYFYSHTLVAGSPLEFSAQQRKMVFGFLMLVGLYLALQLAADTGQDTAVSLFLVAGAVLAPYFWGSAMRFRLSATRWRGVRLQFAASWHEVYKASWPVFALALLWIVLVLALQALIPELPAAALEPDQARRGAAWPVVTPAMWALIALGVVLSLLCIIRLEFNYQGLLVSRAHIGSQPGRWKPVYRDFVRIWLATAGVLVLCLALTVALLALLLGGSLAMVSGMKGMGLLALLFIFVMVIGLVFTLLVASAPARAYREARMFRLVWGKVGVSHVARFKCKLRTRGYVLLRLKNMFLTLITLGFYRPFAMVSEYRMKTESVTLHLKGGVDQLVGQLVSQQGGFGDAVADAVGLDLVG